MRSITGSILTGLFTAARLLPLYRAGESIISRLRRRFWRRMTGSVRPSGTVLPAGVQNRWRTALPLTGIRHFPWDSFCGRALIISGSLPLTIPRTLISGRSTPQGFPRTLTMCGRRHGRITVSRRWCMCFLIGTLIPDS